VVFSDQNQKMMCIKLFGLALLAWRAGGISWIFLQGGLQ